MLYVTQCCHFWNTMRMSLYDAEIWTNWFYIIYAMSTLLLESIVHNAITKILDEAIERVNRVRLHVSPRARTTPGFYCGEVGDWWAGKKENKTCTIKILRSIPYIHNIHVFRLYPLHRSNINNIFFYSILIDLNISLFVCINKLREGGSGGRREVEGGIRWVWVACRGCLNACLTLKAVLVVLSPALRYIPLRLSSSFKTIFFVNVITV